MQEKVDSCFCDNGLFDDDITSMKDKFHLQQFEINSILQSAYTHDGNMCVLVDWIGDYEPSWELLQNIKTSVENMPEHMVHSDIPVMLFEIKSISQIIKKKDGQQHVLVDWVGDYEPSWELLENMPISIRNWGNYNNVNGSAAFIEEFHEPVVPDVVDDRSDRPFLWELYENIKKGIRNWGKNNNVKESANIPGELPEFVNNGGGLPILISTTDMQEMRDLRGIPEDFFDLHHTDNAAYSSLQPHKITNYDYNNEHLHPAKKPHHLQNINPPQHIQQNPQVMKQAMYPQVMQQAMYPQGMQQAIYPQGIQQAIYPGMPQTYPQAIYPIMQHPYQQRMPQTYPQAIPPIMQHPYQQGMPHQYQPVFQNPHQQKNYIPLQAHQQFIPVQGRMLGPVYARS